MKTEYLVVFIGGGVMQDFEIVQTDDTERLQAIADEWDGDPDDDVYYMEITSTDGVDVAYPFSHIEHWKQVTHKWEKEDS